MMEMLTSEMQAEYLATMGGANYRAMFAAPAPA